jgi:hypothetical protein
MSDEIQLPDLFDISGDTQAQADAAMDPTPTPPPTALTTIAKNGDEYTRWNEFVTIEGAEMSRSAKGHTCLMTVAKIRPSGDPSNKNVGKKVFTRLFINFPTLQAKQLGQPFDEKLDGMNTRSIGTLNSLLKSTGYLPEKPGLPMQLLKVLFPMKVEGVATAKSPLQGKTAVASLVRSPNKGEGARSPWQVQAESFLATPKNG